MIYVGVDIGKGGGLAAVKNGRLVAWCGMPLDESEIDIEKLWEFYGHLISQDLTTTAIEQAQKFSAGTLALCSLWYNFGQLTSFFKHHHLKMSIVSPRTWQAATLGKIEKGKSKEAAEKKFIELFNMAPPPRRPRGTKAHDGIVDAALIAHWIEVSSSNGTLQISEKGSQENCRALPRME